MDCHSRRFGATSLALMSVEQPIAQVNETEKAKRLSAIRDRARIFREVLGTPRGKLVLDFLVDRFKTTSGYPPNQLDNQGRTDALQTWRKQGHFDVIHFINDQLSESYEHTSSSRS